MDWTDAFDAYVTDQRDRDGVPAVAVGLARGGTPVYFKGLGYAREPGSPPPTAETVFGIGSITKSFTAVAILQLQERGVLSVHDPVTRFLPEFRLPRQHEASGVTLHHFLTHASGLPPLPFLFGTLKRSMADDPSVRDDADMWKLVEATEAIDTYEDLMEAIAGHDIDLTGAPGAAFSYSNDAYALLGAIVERASGMPYATFVRENILEPAGMRASQFEPVFAPEVDVASLYSRRDEEGQSVVVAAPVWWHAPAHLGAGFLKSTVSDMLRYAEIYRSAGVVSGERLLSPDSVRQMTMPYMEAAPGRWYGYGLFVTPRFHGGTLIEHGGSVKGVQAQLCIVPERGLTSVVLTNVQGAPAEQIAIGVMQAAMGTELGEEVWTYESQLDNVRPAEVFVGRYVSGEGATLEFVQEDGSLVLRLAGESYPMERLRDDLFLVRMKDVRRPLRFWFDEGGLPHAISFALRMIPKEAVP